MNGSGASGKYPALPGMPEQVPSSMSSGETGSTAMTIDNVFSNQNYYTSAFSCCGPEALTEFQVNSQGGLTLLTAHPTTLAGSAAAMAVATPQ